MRRMYSENQLENKIESIIESGEIENAKPMYYHPITAWDNSYGSISFIILNNESGAYDTKTKIKNAIKDFQRVAPITGAVKTDDGNLIVSYAYKNSSVHLLMGVYTSGTVESGSGNVSLETFIDNCANVADGVNKIN